ncbi:hypothetical protein CROST_048030 (plasmid) [Clostridium felsineum]|uniref:Uncharacterized protein n=3 Tax=Bacteria TaxID=2 RepID=A0A1L9P1S5_9RHOB|nr:hypothetical protein CLIT_3c00010 [Peptoclostridium litorale DSM 5388]OJI95364.1 hypothetical protein PFRI_03910 [Planktotalea frisia]URZ04691.1 hypothetical protein CLAUR_047800 [Clostridium felsineum]URZ14025.1 hypothetical protein CROST_048030 [Clostridium felsineum]
MDPVGVERLGDRLEEGRAAVGAVAAAAGGQAVGDTAVGVQRTAGVAGLGADRGLDETGHDVAAAVVDGGVEGGDPAAVGAGGGAAPVDGRAHGRRARARDVHAAHGAGLVHRAVGVAHDAVVVAREGRPGGGAQRGRVRGVRPPGAGTVGAVTGGQEVVVAAVVLDVEAQRAAPAARVDGVTAGDELLERARGALDGQRAGVGSGLLLDLVDLGLGDPAVDGDDDTVGLAVDGPGGARDVGLEHRVARLGELGGAEGGHLGRVRAGDRERGGGHEPGGEGDQPGRSRDAAAGGGALDPHFVPPPRKSGARVGSGPVRRSQGRTPDSEWPSRPSRIGTSSRGGRQLGPNWGGKPIPNPLLGLDSTGVDHHHHHH